MFRKLGLAALVCASAFFTVNAEASTYKTVLLPEDPQPFTNYLFKTIEATCKVETPDESNTIEIIGMNLTGSVNGIPISKGTHFNIDIHNGDLLYITAKSAAQVNLTNHGKHAVSVNCTY